MKNTFAAFVIACSAIVISRPAIAQDATWPATTYYRYATIAGDRLFYRDSGGPEKPVLVLLHGYPASSHTYRNLIPLLSGRYRIIAPDYLGSGYSDKPDPEEIRYSFDLLADKVDALLESLNVQSYVVYFQDFGAPVGFRLMTRHPSRVRGFISQNGNAYIEGIAPAKLEFFRSAGSDRSDSNVQALFEFTGSSAIRDHQYLRDVAHNPEIMSPDAWTIDSHHLESKAERLIQVQLFQDYTTNLDAYSAWQAYLRKHRPPALVVWGRKDPVFTPNGARAYLRDLPDARVVLLDAGHFAVEERPVEIAKEIIKFMDTLPADPRGT